jgi:BatD DUF11 like domain
MRLWLVIGLTFATARAFADVSVVATVDRNRISFGESVALTVSVQGTQSGEQPSIPNTDGLTFAGPSTQTSVSIVNGAMSQSLSFVYQLTPTRTGEFTIPAIEVNVGGKSYFSAPIKLVVEKAETQADSGQTLLARVRLTSPQLYLGQTAPLEVLVFSRADVPLKGLAGFNCDADGLGFKFLNNLKSGAQVINGESFNIQVIQGAISPTRTGTLNFGPCSLQAQIADQHRRGSGWPFDGSAFDEMIGRVQTRTVPMTIDAAPVEVLPLPDEGRPADFGGAVGQWNLDVTAKPTNVAVGDPITLTIKISGNGNIDTVPAPKIGSLDEFKTYDPTTKTTKDELNTTGERVIQQVLIAKSTDVKQLPEIRLAYFDPAAKAYRTAIQSPISLVVKAGGAGASTIVSGGNRLRPNEKLGQDIVYLKGDLGPAATGISTGTFWVLNIAPVLALAGAVGWKRRTDKLRGDVAYARRSRAAKKAHKLLAGAANCDEIQRALQSYLGDRLNIPSSGITASVADEHHLPAEVAGVFETCDAARFAGATADLAALKQSVERLIDELETNHL